MWDTLINAHDKTNISSSSSSNNDPKLVTEGNNKMEKLKEEAEE
jgi:hypothetical protein